MLEKYEKVRELLQDLLRETYDQLHVAKDEKLVKELKDEIFYLKSAKNEVYLAKITRKNAKGKIGKPPYSLGEAMTALHHNDDGTLM